MTFVCSHCGAQIEAGPDNAGKTVACSQCGQEIALPIMPPPLEAQPQKRSSRPAVACLVIGAIAVAGLTVLAILASIALPVYNSITERAKITKTLSNVKQINLAIRTYAIDHEGKFPSSGFAGEGPPPSSTDCFNELIPDYVNVESIFFQPWYPAGLKRVPNEDDDLTPEENCFSYVLGLNEGSPGELPLIAEWFTAGDGHYDQSHPWWPSGKAVVGRVDGSARAENIDRSTGRVIDPGDGSDLFVNGGLHDCVLTHP